MFKILSVFVLVMLYGSPAMAQDKPAESAKPMTCLEATKAYAAAVRQSYLAQLQAMAVMNEICDAQRAGHVQEMEIEIKLLSDPNACAPIPTKAIRQPGHPCEGRPPDPKILEEFHKRCETWKPSPGFKKPEECGDLVSLPPKPKKQ